MRFIGDNSKPIKPVSKTNTDIAMPRSILNTSGHCSIIPDYSLPFSVHFIEGHLQSLCFKLPAQLRLVLVVGLTAYFSSSLLDFECCSFALYDLFAVPSGGLYTFCSPPAKIVNFLLCMTKCKIDLSCGKQPQASVSRFYIDVSDLITTSSTLLLRACL